MTGHSPRNPDYSILSAFEGPIAPPRTTFLYHCGLLLVAVTMISLMLAYFALVGLLVYAVYYHAVYHFEPMMGFHDGPGRRLRVLRALLYFTPLLFGVVVIFFMFKPLFAARAPRAQPLALNPSHEPLLYAFIEKICDTVGAPSPKRIDLDCDLNAAAAFRRGFLSLFSNDLVLVIGLPLVANLTARELAGVIAHEFGHFTQGVGMRLSFVVRSIIGWFGRVVFERDAWDVALEQWSVEAEDAFTTCFVLIIQLAVGASRLVLRSLMFVGIAVCGFMLRQMEYHADAYQIKVEGSDSFEQTERKFATLQAAMEATYKYIKHTFQNKQQLPDNLCELVRRSHGNLPAAVLQEIDDRLGLKRTRFYDTHPSPADRIRQARRAAEPGVFHDDRPASALFANFDYPARFVTLLHYTDDHGIPIEEDMLVHVQSPPSPSVAAAPAAAPQGYFLDVLPVLLPFKLLAPAASANFESDAAELDQLAGGLKNLAAQLGTIASQYGDAARKCIRARAALRLLDARVPIRPEDFNLTEASPDAARRAEAEALAAKEALRHSTREVQTAFARRLQLGLALRLADRGEYGGGPVSAERIHELVTALNNAADDYGGQFEILSAVAVLDHLLKIKNEGGETPLLSRALAAQTEMVNSFIVRPTVPPAESKPQATLRLTAKQSHASPQEIEGLRRKTVQWFADYHGIIAELAEIAQVAEGISA